jgi:hypothetical protein
VAPFTKICRDKKLISANNIIAVNKKQGGYNE